MTIFGYFFGNLRALAAASKLLAGLILRPSSFPSDGSKLKRENKDILSAISSIETWEQLYSESIIIKLHFAMCLRQTTF